MTNSVSSMPWHVQQQEGYKTYWSGSHNEGDFVQAYAPDAQPTDKPKVIIYLHGFALCLPKFYAAHLESLVQQGFFVIFPDFQQSDYPNPDQPAQNTFNIGFWLSILGTTIFQLVFGGGKDSGNTETMPNGCRSKKLTNPKFWLQLRLPTALIVFTIIFAIYSIFARTYGKNLLKLVSTVASSLFYNPAEWVENAIALSENAITRMAEDYPILQQSKPEVVVFGHSLGGLLALSWCHFLNPNQTQLQPLQVFTADPAPSTEMGIPSFVVWILKIFRIPFATNPVVIKDTGTSLTVPVTILHGADDTLVRPEVWVKPSGSQTQTNFDYIASTTKKIYFSLSFPQPDPTIIAFHNQAVTDTTYFDDDLFNNFGGVKTAPNAYNTQLIWPWLQGITTQNIQPDQLPIALPPDNPALLGALPDRSKNMIIPILGIIGVILFCGWLWQRISL